MERTLGRELGRLSLLQIAMTWGQLGLSQHLIYRLFTGLPWKGLMAREVWGIQG